MLLIHRLVMTLFLAGITASYGKGFQFQSLYYVLIVLLGGLTNDADWLLISTAHVVFIAFSGLIRSSSS